jgi:hypothetical protein
MDLIMDGQRRCPTCGGAVGADGRPSVLARRLSTAHAAPARYVQPPADDDPLPQLNPVQRFNQAIERRDQLVRDRRQALVSDRRQALVPDRRRG